MEFPLKLIKGESSRLMLDSKTESFTGWTTTTTKSSESFWHRRHQLLHRSKALFTEIGNL